MKTFLQKNNSKDLIIFFCGWGMDENPFSILKSNKDILYVYDYTTPEFACENIDFSGYDSIFLLAFSYGVYASGIAKLPESVVLKKSVAVNGTLIPVDNEYGVPVRQFELTEKMDFESVVKFRQRLFGGENAQKHFEIFENNLPKRSAKSCTEELIGMKKYVPTFSLPQRKFDKVYIAEHDRCVPTRNQKNFWLKFCQNKYTFNVGELETGHFPFYNYESLDEFLS